jgi:hypothetical protein
MHLVTLKRIRAITKKLGGHMKTLISTGAAFVALLAAHAMAADMPVNAPVYKAPPPPTLQPSGYIELYSGWDDFKASFCDPFGCSSNSNNGWLIGGAGRANWWLDPAWSVQFDAQGEGAQFKLNNVCPSCGDKFSSHSYLVASHLTWRDTQRGIGVVGAIGDISPGIRFGLIGLEGLANWNTFTTYLQGGWGSTVGRNAPIGADVDGWFGRATGRYYPTPNLLLEGTIMGASLTETRFFGGFFLGGVPSFDITSWLWRVKAEAMVNQYFSIYVAYQGSQTNFDPFPGGSERLRDDRVMIGLRAFINRDNLRNNDLTGAPFDVINPLGFFGFAGGGSIDSVD